MNRTAVEQIKERLPIEEVVGQYVKLEKAGKSFKARCPFHNEKTASFFVSPDRGGYYCFGCGEKGDIFSFVERFEGIDFRGALKILAERAGVPLVFDQKADGERDRLFAVMEEAAKYFEAQFSKSKDAQEYVKGRGITDKTRADFRIGWAPEGWSNLHTYLKGKGYNDAILEKAGLIKKKESAEGAPASTDRSHDRFRGRIMFPIADSGGRVIAFSGRILPRLEDARSAKYLNSPDTPLYDKSLVLYGLDKAKSFIRQLNYSILVEGQMDLVLSHQAGVRNVVASSGTALTDESVGEGGAVSNLGLVRRLSPNVIVAFDSDSAGRKAALRAAGIALSLGMDVKIADLVGGKDPADLVKEDVEKWKNALRSAKPVVEFELDNVLRDAPDPRKAPRALRDRVFPFLARMESQMDKAHFVKMISDRASISEDAVWQDLRAVEKVISAQNAASTPAGGSGVPTGKHEGTALPPRGRETGSVQHADLVERRMFGLLALMDSASFPKAGEYRDQIRKVSGDSYADRMARLEPIMSDVIFEAEAFFGSGTDAKRWEEHMNELVLNFEEGLINEKLIEALQLLKTAEKAGDQARVAELARKCQELSAQKAESSKKKRR